MSIDINPENNKDTFQARGIKIKELEAQILFLVKENIDLKISYEYQQTIGDQQYQKIIDAKNDLTDLLKTVEISPREVVFDKEVLTLFINKILRQLV